MYPSAYSRYMDDLNSSQGFYVTDGAAVVGGVRRVDDPDDEHYPRALRAARFAVEDHNKKSAAGLLLRFVDMRSLNFQPAVTAMYYITMRAADCGTGRISFYHAKVWEKLNSGYKVCSFGRAPFSPHPSADDLVSEWYVGFPVQPWMDENYLHYRCFSAEDKIVEMYAGDRHAFVWFRTREDAENFAEKYEGKLMPESLMPYETSIGCDDYVADLD